MTHAATPRLRPAVVLDPQEAGLALAVLVNLPALVRDKRRRLELSTYRAGRQCGLSHWAILRLESGKGTTTHTLRAVMAWLAAPDSPLEAPRFGGRYSGWVWADARIAAEVERLLVVHVSAPTPSGGTAPTPQET